MELNQLTALNPLDGRYSSKTAKLRPYFSEYALMYYRLYVEIHWLVFLAESEQIEGLNYQQNEHRQIFELLQNWGLSSAEHIKSLEKTTNHDVKAVEYYLKQFLENDPRFQSWLPFVHFGCTSEDINNLAYALMVKQACDEMINPAIDELIEYLETLSREYASFSMLARTHGQPASPTTLGKELANYSVRLKRQRQNLYLQTFQAKFSGAVGNFNAHSVAYPDLDWPQMAQAFVEKLGLSFNAYTTQIEPHDYLAELVHSYSRLNTVFIDLARDFWGYISWGYFDQKVTESEVGSSTMPHKVNPINFENAEGNLGLANALFSHFAEKLPISRFQRDLSDSTVMRNLGVAFGYSLLAYQSLSKALNQITPNVDNLEKDLEANWSVLAEAVQTIMRRYGYTDSYETMKNLTRGKTLDQAGYLTLIDKLSLPDEVKDKLRKLTPSDYTGLAKKLALKVHE